MRPPLTFVLSLSGYFLILTGLASRQRLLPTQTGKVAEGAAAWGHATGIG